MDELRKIPSLVDLGLTPGAEVPSASPAPVAAEAAKPAVLPANEIVEGAPTPETVEPAPTDEAVEPVRRVRGRDVLSYREIMINDHPWIEVSLSDATNEHVTPERFAQLNQDT